MVQPMGEWRRFGSMVHRTSACQSTHVAVVEEVLVEADLLGGYVVRSLADWTILHEGRGDDAVAVASNSVVLCHLKGKTVVVPGSGRIGNEVGLDTNGVDMAPFLGRRWISTASGRQPMFTAASSSAGYTRFIAAESDGGRWIASIDDRNSTLIWNSRVPNAEHVAANAEAVVALTATPDARSVVVLDATTGAVRWTTPAPLDSGLPGLVGRMMRLSSVDDGRLRTWFYDLETGVPAAVIDDVFRCANDASGNIFVAGPAANVLRLHEGAVHPFVDGMLVTAYADSIVVHRHGRLEAIDTASGKVTWVRTIADRTVGSIVLG